VGKGKRGGGEGEEREREREGEREREKEKEREWLEGFILWGSKNCSVTLFQVNEAYANDEALIRLESLCIPSLWSVEAHAVDPHTMIGRVDR
jgi:hypothetical protein